MSGCWCVWVSAVSGLLRCVQNVMIQIAPLGLHKTSVMSALCPLRVRRGPSNKEGISSCSSLTPRLPPLPAPVPRTQLTFITHIIRNTSSYKVVWDVFLTVCNSIRGVIFWVYFNADGNASVPHELTPRYKIHIALSLSHKGCEQKLSSYLDHKVQSSHISHFLGLLSLCVSCFSRVWLYIPVKCKQT